MKVVVRHGVLNAKRTSCITEEEKEVLLGWQVRENNQGEDWLLLHGGVTGHESVCLDDYHIPRLRSNDWHACAGTEGRWDTLVVPVAELNRVLDEIFGEERK